jgi:hypothetical protein
MTTTSRPHSGYVLYSIIDAIDSLMGTNNITQSGINLDQIEIFRNRGDIYPIRDHLHDFGLLGGRGEI